jgi:antitoxin component of MazEF toxin-antitoxin module
LSQSLLKELDLKLGDEVNVEIDKGKQEIIITHGHKASQLSLGLKLRPHLRGK